MLIANANPTEWVEMGKNYFTSFGFPLFSPLTELGENLNSGNIVDD